MPKFAPTGDAFAAMVFLDPEELAAYKVEIDGLAPLPLPDPEELDEEYFCLLTCHEGVHGTQARQRRAFLSCGYLVPTCT